VNKYADEPETTPKHLRVVSVFYFSFISQVRASKIKLKQICFISVVTATLLINRQDQSFAN